MKAKKRSIRQRLKRGMTLVEVMMALGISSFVTIGVTAFLWGTGNTIFVSTRKLEINKDIRNFTALISRDILSSNQHYLYRSFDASHRDGVVDRRDEGQSGDFLLLVFTRPIEEYLYSNPDDNIYDIDNSEVHKIVGYFRDANGDNEGPVIRFEIEYTAPLPDTSVTTIEQLLSAYSASNVPDSDEVIELAKGLATNNLFMNYRQRTVLINGEIVHGHDYKRVTDTYNFSVSPRG
ncbi:MAG: PulJ/GspJ family protein [Verrucomicrobiota bacterium]